MLWLILDTCVEIERWRCCIPGGLVSSSSLSSSSSSCQKLGSSNVESFRVTGENRRERRFCCDTAASADVMPIETFTGFSTLKEKPRFVVSAASCALDHTR